MLTYGSRFKSTDFVSLIDPVTGDQVEPTYVDIIEPIEETDITDRFIVIDSTHTWANIAARALADARGWWAIADLSDTVDPFVEFEVGGYLRVPTQARFQLDILSGEVP